jgi:hypothetical protein
MTLSKCGARDGLHSAHISHIAGSVEHIEAKRIDPASPLDEVTRRIHVGPGVHITVKP